jgi:hypothetical protein
MSWIKILVPMILIITGKDHCLQFQNITYRESCGNQILVLSLQPNLYEMPDQEYFLINAKFLYGGSIINDIVLKKSWTLIDSFYYHYYKSHYLTFAGFISIIYQDNLLLLDHLVNSKNHTNDNLILYDLVTKNIDNYESMILINDHEYKTGKFHEIYHEPGNYSVKLLARVNNGQACSCPSYGNGFIHGRFLVGWIKDI